MVQEGLGARGQAGLRHLEDKTNHILRHAGLTECLEFTVETEEDFADGWLPTLDLKMRVDEMNQVRYTFYEKPTGSNKCLQATTALNQNCMMKSLSNEVMRRLSNMSEHTIINEKVEVKDIFSQKMANSGHCLDVIRKSISNGLKGHLRKKERCRLEGKPFHRSSASSSRERRTKKLLQKQSWYKNKQTDVETVEKSKDDSKRGQARGSRVDNTEVARYKNCDEKKGKKQQQPSTVLFIEFSRGGTLQAEMREVVSRLAPLIGFTMRVTERGGTP